MDFVRPAYQLSPAKFTWCASHELQVTRTTFTKIHYKRFNLNPYKVQIAQALLPNDFNKHAEYSIDILDSICIKNRIYVSQIY